MPLSNKVVLAQGGTWGGKIQIEPGHFAIIIKSDDETWPENTIVKVEDATDEYAHIRRFNRGGHNTTLIPKKDLKRVWVVNPTSKLDIEEEQTVVVDPIRTPQKLSVQDPELFEYLGNRVNAIIKKLWSKESYSKYAGKLVKKIGKDQYLPTLDPTIVIANFLGDGNEGTQGFVTAWGEQVGHIFVNKNSVFSYDEVIAHEFSHILSFESYYVAKELFDETLKFGIEDYEMNEEDFLEIQREKTKNIHKLKDSNEIEEAEQKKYFFQPTEIFAHTEQILRMLFKIKRDEIEEVKNSLALGRISENEKDAKIESIKKKPVDEYKNLIVNQLMLDSPKKFDIFSPNERRRLYEQIFENSKKA